MTTLKNRLTALEAKKPVDEWSDEYIQNMSNEELDARIKALDVQIREANTETEDFLRSAELSDDPGLKREAAELRSGLAADERELMDLFNSLDAQTQAHIRELCPESFAAVAL
jgi:hypothetical protein